MNDEELMSVALQSLREGLLPTAELERTWGGRSAGNNRCALCKASILAGLPEIEAVDRRGTSRFFHPRCLNALNGARRRESAETTEALRAIPHREERSEAG